nr:hypothetical protein [Tanacetum cinerariifolium]
MTNLAEHIIVAGAENRPQMLEKSMYDSWQVVYVYSSKEINMKLCYSKYTTLRNSTVKDLDFGRMFVLGLLLLNNKLNSPTDIEEGMHIKASMKSGLATKVKHIDGKLIGKDGKSLKVYHRGEGLDINQFKPGGVPCMLNEESISATDSCDSSHIQPKFDVYLLYVLGINAVRCNVICSEMDMAISDKTKLDLKEKLIDKVFNHLDILHAPFEVKVITTAKSLLPLLV